MLTPARALTMSASSGKPMPHVPDLEALYNYGVTPRHGQSMMIAGRSGSQKSGLAMWLVKEWNLPTLYFSADMSRETASMRLASSYSGRTQKQIEAALHEGGREAERIMAHLNNSPIGFVFGSPLRWQDIDEELECYVELHNSYPEVIVFDNLMDFDGGESDYGAQMSSMQTINEMTRELGCTTLTLHHATDKSMDARNDPWSPPSRAEVKGGLSEKPELALSVALDPHSSKLNMAVIKNRSGKQDLTARTWIQLHAHPELTQFEKTGIYKP